MNAAGRAVGGEDDKFETCVAHFRELVGRSCSLFDGRILKGTNNRITDDFVLRSIYQRLCKHVATNLLEHFKKLMIQLIMCH